MSLTSSSSNIFERLEKFFENVPSLNKTIEIKCSKCGKSDVFENEKHAYMAGWYYPDGQKQNYNVVEICFDCQQREKKEGIGG